MSHKLIDPATQYNSNPFTLAFDAIGRLFKTNVGWAIVLIGVGFLSFIFQIISSIIDIATSGSPDQMSRSPEPLTSTGDPNVAIVLAVIAVILVVVAIAVIVSSVIQTYLTGMFTYVMLQSEQDTSVSFTEAFHEVSKRFWRLFASILLANIKIFAWSLLLIVPGIIAALRFSLLPYLVMDEPADEKGVVATHDKVKSVVRGRLIEIFGVGTVASIIPFVGSTIGIAGRGALYRQLRHYHDKKLEKPSVHWLNYIGLILIGVITALALLVTLVIVLVLIAAR